MSYTALVLDSYSSYKLKIRFNYLEPNWKRYCHHMTINLGKPEDGPAHDLIDKEFELVVDACAKDNKVIAVKVITDVPSKNKTKHITVAVNEEGGGKPKHSNDLSVWNKLGKPLILRGTVKYVS